ncbi:MAG: GyrI-like domain-containing protein [Vicinamibacteraceae bacterium]
MSPHTVRIEQVDAVPLAAIRRQVRPAQLAQVVPECCGLVWEAVRSQRVKAGRHVAVYRDGRITVDVGVELHGPFTDDGEVVCATTPAGTVATVTHLGPYGGLGAAHDAVRQYCEANGHRLAGPSWEVYGHWQREWDADPAAIRTDIYHLLAPEHGV